jgi:hypothetical protein
VVAVNSQREMLIGRRKIFPCKDWWITGGAWVRGKSAIESVILNIKRELNLRVEPDRVLFIGGLPYSFFWAVRQEPPQKNGCHDVSTVFILFVRDEEAKKIVLDEKEYEDQKWILPGEIFFEDSYPAPLRKIAKDVKNFIQEKEKRV